MASQGTLLKDWHYMEALRKTLYPIAKVCRGTMDETLSYMFTKGHITDIMYEMIDETPLNIKKLFSLYNDLKDCEDKREMFKDMSYCIEHIMLRPDIKDDLHKNLNKLNSLSAEPDTKHFTKAYFIRQAKQRQFSLEHEETYVTRNADKEIDDVSEYTALMNAVAHENVRLVESLLKQNRETLNETTSTMKTTALMVACKNKNVKIAEILVNHPNINANMQDSNGLTALMHALLSGNIEAINILVNSKKVDLLMKNLKNGIPGVCYAWGNKQLVDLFATIHAERGSENKIRRLKERRGELEKLKSQIPITKVVKSFNLIASIDTSNIENLHKNVSDRRFELSLSHIIEAVLITRNTEVLNIFLAFINPEKYASLYNFIDYFVALAIIMDHMDAYNLMQNYMVSDEVVGKLVACYNDKQTSSRDWETLLKLSQPLKQVLFIQTLEPESVKHMLDACENSSNNFLEQEDNSQNTLFMLLCCYCNLNVILSIEEKINKQILNAHNKQGKTAFMLSCDNKQKEIPRLLANMTDFLVNNKDNNGNTNLMYAIYYDIMFSTPVISKLLIEKGADVNAVNELGRNPLMIASEYGQCDVASLLISNDAEVNAVNVLGKSALMIASGAGHCDVATLLLQKGASVNAVDKTGQTALMIASGDGHCDVADMLINNKANVNAEDKWGQNALIKATCGGHCNIVTMLIKNKADVKAEDESGQNAIMKASFFGHFNIATILINNGADVKTVDNSGGNSLMKASYWGHCGIAKMLIDHGVDVNTVDMWEQNALMNASSGGHIGVATMLIDKGVEVNKVDEVEQTALMYASYWGHCDVAVMLIENGADVNAVDEDGENALMKASSGGHCGVATMLVNNGAYVNAVDKSGQNALMSASIGGHCDVANMLLEKGSDLNTVNRKGKSALTLAKPGSHMAKLLIEKGADVNGVDKLSKHSVLHVTCNQCNIQ